MHKFQLVFLRNSLGIAVASITKVFTSIAIVRLIEEGLIHLHQPVMEIIRLMGMEDTYFDVPPEKEPRICFGTSGEFKWFQKSKQRPFRIVPRGGGGIEVAGLFLFNQK